MSNEVASLVVTIDSSQTTQATKALQGLQAAAAPVTAAMSTLTNAAKPAAAATASLATATAAVAPATAAIASAAAPATAATASLASSANSAASAHSALSTQAMSAFHSLRSMFEGIASGMPATTVLTQQLNHLGYAASGPGGLVGAFGEVFSSLGRLVTPTTVLIGSLGALGVAAFAAMTKWEESQSAVQIGLLGIGQASGQTLASLNKIAASTSSLSTISQSQALTTATALASTGKIGGDAIALLTGNVKNLSIALGTDVKTATEVLAKAFSDPAKGAVDLGDRLGGVNAATLTTIQNLQAQGDRQGAINVLSAAIIPIIKNATNLTSGWAQAWNKVGNAASNALTNVGKALSGENPQAMSESTLETRRKSLEAEIASLMKQKETPSAPSFGSLLVTKPGAIGDLTNNIAPSVDALDQLPSTVVSEHLNKLTGELLMVNEQLMKIPENAKKSADTLEDLTARQTLRPQFDQFLPEINQRQTLANSAAAIGGVSSSLIAKMGLTPEEAERAKAIINDLKAHYQTAFQQMQTSSSIALQAVTAFSPTARATIAELQTIEQVRGRADLSPQEKATAAQNAYNLSLKQTTTALSEVAREQLLSANLGTDAARVQLQTIGASVGETYRLTAVEQARAQLVTEAARNRTAVDQAQLAALTKQIGLTAQLKQAEAEKNLQSNTSFNTAQLGRTDLDQQVASQLRAVHGDQYTDFMNSAIADQIRFNSLLGDTKTAASSALSSFITDLAQGRTATQALQTALQGVERKLIDMASNAIISNLFKNLLSTGLGGGGGGGGFFGLFPTSHSGGIVGSEHGPSRAVNPAIFADAPRFHSGGLVGGERAIIAKDDEGIFTKAQMRALAPVGQGGGNGGGNNVQVNVNNHAPGTTVEHRKSSSGGFDVHDFVIKAVGDHMASGGFDGIQRARFGNQVKPRGR